MTMQTKEIASTKTAEKVNLLLTVLSELVHCKPEEIDTTKSLMDYGLDSIRLFELSGVLEEQFNFIAEPAILYEMPSIESLLNKVKENEQRSDIPKKHQPSLPLNMIICASFTSEPVDEGLYFIYKALHYAPVIQFTQYNQIIQELLNPSSFFNQFNDGPRTLLIRLEDFFRFEKGKVNQTKLFETVNQLIAAIEYSMSVNKMTTLLCLCPHTPQTLKSLGIESIEEADQMLLQVGKKLASLYVLDLREPSERSYQLTEIHDPVRNSIGHIPYTTDYFLVMALELARKYFMFTQKPKKAFMVDCDNVLWEGVVAEEGPTKVVINKGHQKLHQLLTKLHQSGVLICLCSKNIEEDVWAVFDKHPDMLLKKEYITTHRINWQPKSSNIIEIAEELNLNPDSFVFIDDNPVEQGEVLERLPKITSILSPTNNKNDDLLKFYEHCYLFETLKATKEDLLRSQSYKQEKERLVIQQNTSSFEEFLQNLAIQIDIEELADIDIPRASQLTKRTNQFNATTICREEADFFSLKHSDKYGVYSVKVRDKFGDYGFVGLMVISYQDTLWQAETFLMSCRVLGRRVEHSMLQFIAQKAKEGKINLIQLPFKKTNRNLPIKMFYDSLGLAWQSDDTASHEYLAFSPNEAEQILDKAIHLNLKDIPKENSAMPKIESDHTNNLSQPLQKIAELRGNISTLHQWIDKESIKPRPALSSNYLAPKSSWQKLITETLANILHIDRVGITDNFYELGLDSLKSAELLARLIEHHIPDNISLQNMENQTALALAELIEQNDTTTPQQKYAYSLEDDCQLPAFLDHYKPTQPNAAIKTLLLTGGSGFLGAFLMNEWLQQTKVHIICLVRAESESKAREKIINNLLHYDIPWHQEYEERISYVLGDMKYEQFGINDDSWKRLSQTIDAIFHCGAWVNFSYPYKQLRKENVESVITLLQLATSNPQRSIQFHFISTFGVTMSPDYRGKYILETEELTHSEGLLNGYEQTKYVADKLIWRAMKKGLPAAIYRPALVTGLTTGKYHKLNEFFPCLIKGCIQMGSVPLVDSVIEYAPVDFISKSIVALAKNPNNLGQAYFSLHPKPFRVNDLVTILQNEDYRVRTLPWDIWKKEFLQKNPVELRKNALFPFIDFIRAISEEQAFFPDVDKSNFNKALQAEHLTCLDQQTLFTNYIQYFKEIGFI